MSWARLLGAGARRYWPVFVVMPIIGLVLSATLTWLNVGFSSDFLVRWARAFASSVPAMLIAFALMGTFQRSIDVGFRSQPVVIRKTILALLTACVMELMVSSAVTMSNLGVGAGFLSAWASAFVQSLPLGVGISLLMGFVIKPRIDRLTADCSRIHAGHS